MGSVVVSRHLEELRALMILVSEYNFCCNCSLNAVVELKLNCARIVNPLRQKAPSGLVVRMSSTSLGSC